MHERTAHPAAAGDPHIGGIKNGHAEEGKQKFLEPELATFLQHRFARCQR